MHLSKKSSIFLSLILAIGVICGAGIFSNAQEEPNNSVNLTVGENIVSHFYLDAQAYESRGASKYRYSYNNGNTQEKTEIVSDVESFDENKNAQGIVQIDVAQAAAQIAEPITVEILDEDEKKIDEIEYTAKSYCDSVITMSDEDLLGVTSHPDDLKKLCKAIVTYGKSAQGIFETYMAKEGSVAINDNYASDLNLDSAVYDSSAYTKTDGNIRFRSVSFMCESTAKMRFYFTPLNQNDSTDYGNPAVSAPFEASWSKGVDPDGAYNLYIQINNIAPALFDEPIVIEYAGATIRMSVLDYAGKIIDSGATTAELKTLAKSLIRYNETADEFFSAPATVFVPAKASTCTENGCIAHYELGGKSYSDANAENEIDASLQLLAHSYGEYVQVSAPTCTNKGSEKRTCQVCGAEDFRDIDVIEHSYTAAVTAPTCTAQGYTTYTCSACGDSYTGEYTDATGHNYGAWSVTTGATLTTTGTETKTCANNSAHTESRTVKSFTFKLPNTDSYLYRVGNANTVTLGTFFGNESGANITGISVTTTKDSGTATCTYNANSTDWRSGTLKFNNTGVMTVTLKHGNATVKSFKLEVVAGTNVTGGNLSNVTSSNTVLFGNVSVPSTVTINNSKTLYGNGFTVTDTRSSTAGTSGYINMNGNGTIDNAVLVGQTYAELVTTGITNEYYSPGVWINGNANIYNSYVSEAKNAIEIKEGTVVIENTTVSGGAFSNIQIGNAKVTLKNCETESSVSGIKGLGIYISSNTCKLNIEGSLKQHNWLKSSDVPSNYSSVLSSFYNDSNYAYTVDGTKYVNMGILCMNETGDISLSDAQNIINDSTNIDYGFVEKSAFGHTGTVYTAKATMGTSTFNTSKYSPTVNGQHPILPSASFDFANKNYKAKTAGDNTYCYYDTATDKVLISFETGSNKVWDTSILTVSKNSNSISPTVAMGSTDYTNKSITFTDEGDYDVVYTYTDPYNYNADGSAYNVTYTKTVHISVSVITPETVIYNAEFSYVGDWANSAKQVIGSDNKTYVMPDVSGTSTKIGSTTVGGKTVYYPIVSVSATSSNGNTAYSNGKGYYFAPAFNAINIKDYNQSTGSVQYTYNSSTTTWPHGKSSSAGPDSAVFGYASGAAYANQPYGRSMDTKYYGFGSNNNGLCYTSNEIEKDNTASTHLVQYHYVSNDGTTYYYYIQYSFSAMTYSSGSCVTPDTLVTLADGSQKRADELTMDDDILVWNFETGEYDSAKFIFIDTDPESTYNVVHLYFSDGTETKLISEHGYFDVELGKYVYITEDNYRDYIGDHFVKLESIEDNTWTTVELIDSEITEEVTTPFGPTTQGGFCFYVDGLLSMPGGVEGMFNIFDVNTEAMTYDFEALQSDIETYGLYTYEDFEDIIPEEVFEMCGGAYLKIAVGKGLITWDRIVEIANRYAPYFVQYN
ncbi:MAG: hypothetical protein E7570_00765 [Ruminococcaceae bacterium]|nr:hypothetical protein [Oscillospiraceae bacterium]